MPAAPLPHYTIFERAYEEGWHVYEVEPLYDVVMDKMWDAWITHAARVVRYVSTARGIIGADRWNEWCEDKSGAIPGSAAQRSRRREWPGGKPLASERDIVIKV